ncbi:reverse transcriptase domain-containing protein [Streptomyces sp. NPDC005989]|uniref:reverse transcriptase domain-containing protein n=1 Tax=Streptomyces sp. NPDC005989 TaxID=3156727 RepID=UPI00340ABEE1
MGGQTIAEFESDLKNNLFKIWNRMSSGSYFPPPVRAVEIEKAHGGTRILGVPSVADRIAQTVVAQELEAKVELIFHPDSYGYRPKRSALDAVTACRQQCWKTDWVFDLDIRKFFDRVPWDLVIKAVEANTDLPWAVLYVRRWLEAPLMLPDGSLQIRDRGTPQGTPARGLLVGVPGWGGCRQAPARVKRAPSGSRMRNAPSGAPTGEGTGEDSPPAAAAAAAACCGVI